MQNVCGSIYYDIFKVLISVSQPSPALYLTEGYSANIKRNSINLKNYRLKYNAPTPSTFPYDYDNFNGLITSTRLENFYPIPKGMFKSQRKRGNETVSIQK